MPHADKNSRRMKMTNWENLGFIKIWKEFKHKNTYFHGFNEAQMIDLLSQSVGIENIRTTAERFGKQRRNQDAPNPYWRHGQGQYAFSEYMMKHRSFDRVLTYGNYIRKVIVEYNGKRTKMVLLKHGRRIKGVTIHGIADCRALFDQSKHSAGQAWYNSIDGDEFRTYGMDNCPAFQVAQKFAGFNPKTMPNFQRQIRQFIKSVIEY